MSVSFQEKYFDLYTSADDNLATPTEMSDEAIIDNITNQSNMKKEDDDADEIEPDILLPSSKQTLVDIQLVTTCTYNNRN